MSESEDKRRMIAEAMTAHPLAPQGAEQANDAEKRMLAETLMRRNIETGAYSDMANG